MEARKSIEREMERFKVCEKEAKVKAFSRAGLGQQDRLDPEEQAKAEAREWINETVTRLQEQVRHWPRCPRQRRCGLRQRLHGRRGAAGLRAADPRHPGAPPRPQAWRTGPSRGSMLPVPKPPACSPAR
jgi:hypothetical protein